MSLDEISIIFSFASLIISFFTLFFHIKISYPNIKITNLQQTIGNEKKIFLLAYSKSAKALFLFAKFNVINVSPIAGSMYNCEIKYKHSSKSPALTKEDIEALPDDVKDIYLKYNSNSILFDTSYTAYPLSTQQVLMVFKLNSKFLLSNLQCKLTANYYANSKHNINLAVPLTFYHYADDYDYQQMYIEMIKQERLDFEKFYTQRKLENKKVITMTKRIINFRFPKDKK